ncbi:MAG TPA: TIGR03118 family protein, partial [Chthoniobacterales bacterium]|nr:TIGR03118 family protein [Chthoniobacterales bacterium]
MKTIHVPRSFGSFGAALVISGLPFFSALLPCASAQNQEAKKANFFDWENLQSDIAGVADRTDSNLVNSWGLVINSTAKVFWVSDNGSGVSTLYGLDGTPVLLGGTQNFVTLPPTKVDTATPPASPTSAPTGIVLNTSPSAFLIPNTKSPAIFMWDGEDGGIWGWNPAVNMLNAVLIVQPTSSDATVNNVFKGLAIADRKSGGPALYATNFRAGEVFVYDTNFDLVAQFTDPNPPLPVPAGTAGWAPFGIANIDGLLYVTFAAQNAVKHDDLAGAGRGFVDVFTPEGVLVKRLIVGG